MKQLLGYFKVMSPGFSTKTVLVQQEVMVNGENTIVSARKVFTLDALDGERVYRMTNPKFFLQQDGTVLKITGKFQTDVLLPT